MEVTITYTSGFHPIVYFPISGGYYFIDSSLSIFRIRTRHGLSQDLVVNAGKYQSCQKRIQPIRLRLAFFATICGLYCAHEGMKPIYDLPWLISEEHLWL